MAMLLVIDDDAIIRISLMQLLAMEGYEVHGAGNGQEALDLLKRHAARTPCLIVLDLMMPVMDGIEFRRTQLLDAAIAHVPVVIVTGKSDLAEVEALQPLKVIRKPFQPSIILDLAEEHCRCRE